MNLNQIRLEKQKAYEYKNIKPLRELLNTLKSSEDIKITYDNAFRINSCDNKLKEEIFNIAWQLRPWRKGPFELFGNYIDSEWQSFIKFNILKKYFNLKDKIIADIGCNNGYYMFKMLEFKPKEIIGFDPSAFYQTQFNFINFYAKTNIKYELLGIEHIEYYEKKFDVIFCLGVLYHRISPIECLKSLKKALNENGEIFIDTFFINTTKDFVLSPAKNYSKIPNVYFIPSISALRNWCFKAGFKNFEVLETKITDEFEQRKTKWIQGQSLKDFLDPLDSTKTIEGYPAPNRLYVKMS